MLRRLIVAAIIACAPAAASAHPHEFVTMKVTTLFDAAGAVVGMRYNWLFDEFFSAYALEGQDANANGKAEQSELDALQAEILGNIAKIGYFTAYDENALVPQVAAAKPVAAALRGRQLDLTFELSFATPVRPTTDKPLRYAIYDDEFYIAMTHDAQADAIVLEGAPAGCTSELTEPDPGEDLQAFASSLGKDDSGGPDLGAAFAEWVSISCP